MPERLDRQTAGFRTRQLGKGALVLSHSASHTQIISSVVVSLFGLVRRTCKPPQIRFESPGFSRALVVGRVRALLRESAA
jgi:hypothetical protein